MLVVEECFHTAFLLQDMERIGLDTGGADAAAVQWEGAGCMSLGPDLADF